jgi:hypothetical protein
MRLRIRVSNPMYRYRHTYANYMQIPEYHEYEGEIVSPKPKWLKDDQFMMDTGTDESILRVLDKDRIICGWTVSNNAKLSDPTSVTVTSQSTGKSYIVSLADRGLSLSCNCMGYSYRKTCSHVQEVMEAA